MTPAELIARAHAYDEAASHLERGLWTDDEAERQQGVSLAKQFRWHADQRRKKAAELERRQ